MYNKLLNNNNYTQCTYFTAKQVNKTTNRMPTSFLSGVSFGNTPGLKETNSDTVTIASSKPTRIRSAEELTPKDVVKILDDQLNIITAEQIEKEIIAPFGKADREFALKALKSLCQFASLRSLNVLAENIRNLKRSSRTLIIEDRGSASLTSNMGYLRKKGNFTDLCINDDYKEMFNSVDGSILLDNNLLQQLKADPAFLEKIKNSKNIKSIVYPEGWINGINPFNQDSLETFKEKLAVIMPRAKQIQKEKKLNATDAILEALNEPIIKDMEELGLRDKLVIISTIKIPKISKKISFIDKLKNLFMGTKIDTNKNNETSITEDKRVDIGDIEKMLVPDKLSEEELTRIIKKNIPEIYRQAALEILAQQAKVFSPRSLSLIAKQQHKEITAIAHKKGIDKNNIYYYIPDRFKSYGMITMIYQIANKISNEKIITDFHKFTIKNNLLLVVLDDLAATGSSLEGVYLGMQEKIEAKKSGFTVECLISPMVSTEKALDLFCKRILEDSTNPDLTTKLNYCPAIKVTTLKKSPFYKSLPEKEQKLVDKIIDDRGCNNTNVSVAFPYMGPDNNNALFATLFAEYFTLNKKGVKKYDTWNCPTD